MGPASSKTLEPDMPAATGPGMQPRKKLFSLYLGRLGYLISAGSESNCHFPRQAQGAGLSGEGVQRRGPRNSGKAPLHPLRKQLLQMPWTLLKQMVGTVHL